MFVLATLIGIYSYCILFLGIAGLLYKPWLFTISILFIFGSLFYLRTKTIYLKKDWLKAGKEFLQTVASDKTSLFLFFLLFLQALINLIGTLGPELSFDSLWYHLTFPKLFLEHHRVFFIPGNLLYYSAMPKLTEMLYIPALSFGNEIFAKLIHFSFGILTLGVIYKIAKRFVPVRYAFLACVIFYANLVVSWESITAYVDLARTFFEAMAFLGFLHYIEKKERKWIIDAAVFSGFAIATKLIAVGSLIVFAILLIYFASDFNGTQAKKIMSGIPVYLTIAIFIALPWFVISFVQTGNPVYPLFTSLYPVSIHTSVFNPLVVLKTFRELFMYAADPINPLYLMIIPLIVLFRKKFSKPEMYLVWYSTGALVIWYLTPQTGGGRFILPYLPVFSILAAIVIKKIQDKKIQSFLVGIAVSIVILSIGYRGIANKKYLPVVSGKKSKKEFLTKNLNFSFGDFYDTDGYFAKTIKPKDTVLLYGFHNLYYVNFPFIDASWIKKGNMFNYIAVQDSILPSRFSFWNLIYTNDKTHVNVYSLGGMKWAY